MKVHFVHVLAPSVIIYVTTKAKPHREEFYKIYLLLKFHYFFLGLSFYK